MNGSATRAVCPPRDEWRRAPQKYAGMSMAESHSHLKITSTEWEAFLDDFQQTLDKFAVPTAEQAELKAIVNSTQADIVIDSEPARSAA
jgi:truncated hemoglobin YjbI